LVNKIPKNIGIDYKSKNVNVNNSTIKLKIWDTAGQERFRNITQQYYKGADGIVLVFDVTDRNSYEKVRDWMKQIQQYTQRDSIGMVLLGNKCDCDNGAVTPDEAEILASEFNLKYFETSALNNTNIEESFRNLAEEIMKVKNLSEPTTTQPEKKVNLNKPNTDKQKKKGCC
jgi:small GTP-binding protein